MPETRPETDFDKFIWSEHILEPKENNDTLNPEEMLKELKRIHQAINWRITNGINQGSPERQWLEHQQRRLEELMQ